MRFGIYADMQCRVGKPHGVPCDEFIRQILTILTNFGGVEDWKSIRAQQLFAEHVMPAFRD